MRKLIFLFACLLLAAPCPARIIYVDANTPDNNDGSSWAKAYKYLQDALADATSDPNVDEIWVAQGIYKPDQSSTDPNGNGARRATFQLINNVALKGGYAGLGETDPNARNIELYETILSGDLDGNDVDVNDPCDLPNEPTRNENSLHVVTGGDTEPNTLLDGFTIAAGNANLSAPHAEGGGMNNWFSNPTVTNCTFIGNSAKRGGAMHNVQNSIMVTDCIFSENWADFVGGGISNYQTDATIKNCTFIGNSAKSGGAMYNTNRYHFPDPMLVNCLFVGNSASLSGGGVFNNESSPTVNNCIFSANMAKKYDGGGMFNDLFSDTMLVNCTFSGNSANRHGGGMDNDYFSDVTLINCILWGDEPDEIVDNYLGSHSVSFSDVQGGWPGEGNIDADPCFAEPGYWHPNDIPLDANDDFWVDGDYHLKSEAGRWRPSIYADLDPTGDRFINLLDFAAFASFWREKGGFIPADMDNTGLVDLSDLALLLDNYLMSYTLGVWVFDEATSPCIDAGGPNSDWTAELWSHGKRINMGAYGGTPEASMSLSDVGNIANLDNDPADNVDFNDLGIFASKWCEEEVLIAEDLNRDGVVNFVDYAIFADEWLW